MKPYNIVRFCRAFKLFGYGWSGKVVHDRNISPGGNISGKDT